MLRGWYGQAGIGAEAVKVGERLVLAIGDAPSEFAVAALRPVQRLRVMEAEQRQVVDDVAAGEYQHMLIAQRRELAADRVVVRSR